MYRSKNCLENVFHLFNVPLLNSVKFFDVPISVPPLFTCLINEDHILLRTVKVEHEKGTPSLERSAG